MLAFARLYQEGVHDFIFQMKFREYFPEVNRKFIGDFILLNRWTNLEIDGQHWHEPHKKEDLQRDRIIIAHTKLKIVRLRNKEWRKLESG
jgi:very-short-patch-repair endonuclease